MQAETALQRMRQTTAAFPGQVREVLASLVPDSPDQTAPHPGCSREEAVTHLLAWWGDCRLAVAAAMDLARMPPMEVAGYMDQLKDAWCDTLVVEVCRACLSLPSADCTSTMYTGVLLYDVCHRVAAGMSNREHFDNFPLNSINNRGSDLVGLFRATDKSILVDPQAKMQYEMTVLAAAVGRMSKASFARAAPSMATLVARGKEVMAFVSGKEDGVVRVKKEETEAADPVTGKKRKCT